MKIFNLKTTLLLLSLSLLTVFGAAQTPYRQHFAKVKWGPVMELQNSHSMPKGLYGPFNGHFAELRSNGRKEAPSLNFYDVNTLKQTKTINLENYIPKDGNRWLAIDKFFLLKQDMVLIMSNYDKKTNMENVYALKISLDGSVDGRAKKIYSAMAEKRRKAPTINFVESEDSLKILLAINPFFKRYSQEKFEYILYDDNLNKIWAKNVSLPFLDKNFIVDNYQVDKNGNIYMIAKISSKEASVKKDHNAKAPKHSWIFKILAFYSAQDKVQQYDLKLKNDYWITNMSFNLSNNQNLIATGFYATDKWHGVKGMFYLRFNPKTKQIEQQNLAAFTPKLLSNFMSDKKVEKGKRGLSNFKFTFQITFDDGSLIILAEQQYSYTVCTTTAQGVTICHTYYVAGNIIAVKFNPSGTVEWMKDIPKSAISSSPIAGFLYSAYYFDSNTGNTYVVFDDALKNYTKPPKDNRHYKGIGGIGKKTVTTIIQIDPKGNMKRKVLFLAKQKEEKVYVLPAYNFNIKNGLIVIASGHKKYRYAEITF